MVKIPMDVTVVAIVTTERQQLIPADDVHIKASNDIVIMMVMTVIVYDGCTCWT